MFVPANRPEQYVKAATSGADAVILDLEDAVSPDAKDEARTQIYSDFTDLPLILRINAAGTPWHKNDVSIARSIGLSAVMLPKAEDPECVQDVADALDLPVVALIETAAGLSCAKEIAALPGVIRLAFGSIDFCADLGCMHLRDVLLPARLKLVLASRIAGIAAPIDGVTTQLDDPKIVTADTRHARSLGMTGKLCIHPKQVIEVCRGFTPTAKEREWAHRVLASGDGAVAVDGAMVDRPVRLRARVILATTE